MKTLTFRQIINRFTKEIKSFGADEFYISRKNKYDLEDYQRRFFMNDYNDQKELILVKKWIMSKPNSSKKVGIGVDYYVWFDNKNNVRYWVEFTSQGHYYLNIKRSKY